MLAAQTPQENCVAHNGSLIPIPGRNVRCEHGIRAACPCSIGPMRRTRSRSRTSIAGRSTRPARGRWLLVVVLVQRLHRRVGDRAIIFELKPSAFISKNEIEAAKSNAFEQLNVQDQPKLVWPKSFSISASVSRPMRRQHLSPRQLATISQALDRAEHLGGEERQAALTKLQGQLGAAGAGSGRPRQGPHVGERGR